MNYIYYRGGKVLEVFLGLNMYESNGEELIEGDLAKIWAMQNLTFTSNFVIHEHWLNSDIDNIGIEFTYFKLVNNEFKIVKTDNWIHIDGKAINNSKF